VKKRKEKREREREREKEKNGRKEEEIKKIKLSSIGQAPPLQRSPLNETP
jgi:hypothetical protein